MAVSVCETGCSGIDGAFATIRRRLGGKPWGMDPILDIPRNRKPSSHWRLCLLMGLTILLILLLSTRFEEVGLLLAALAVA